MSPPVGGPEAIIAPGRTWSNWHGTVTSRVEKKVDVWNARGSSSSQHGYNATTSLLQSLIAEALGRGVTIRAAGGTWSMSDVAAGDGIVVNTRPLNYRFAFFRNQIEPSYPSAVSNLLFVQCGTSIADLNVYLASKRQCLHTSGASNGQTIVGAMATGTHGAAIGYGSVQDFIHGIHLIVSATESVWLERASRPVLTEATALAFATRVVRDDAIFNAALINLGSLGIVHGVLIEAADRYYLHSDRWRVTYDERFLQSLDGPDFGVLGVRRDAATRPYHLQLLLNPYDLGSGVFVTTMYRDSAQTDVCRPATRSAFTQGDSALEVISALTDMAPRLSSKVVTALLGLGYSDYKDVCGLPGDMFRDTTTRGKVASTALGVPLGSVRVALERVLALAAASHAPALVALRFVRGSPARLAVARHSPITCVLEIDGPASERMADLYQTIWGELDRANIDFSFHCGKMNNLSAATLDRRVGAIAAQEWRAARRELLRTDPLRNAFSNDFLRRSGLGA